MLRLIIVVVICFAVLANAYTLREAAQDAWTESRDPTRPFVLQLIAFYGLRNQIIPMVLQVVLLALRIWSLNWKLPPASNFLTYCRIDMAVVTLGQLLLAANSFWNMYDRRRLMRQVGQDLNSADGI